MGGKERFICKWMETEAANRRPVSQREISAREFDAPPTLVPFAQMDYWFLAAPVTWTHPDTKPSKIVVPRGFVTDFASIPRAFWSLFPPIGSYGLPAIMHDWLYWTQSLDRKTSDLLFYMAMCEMQTSRWKRYPIYSSLRLFGWTAWHANARAKTAGERRILGIFPTDPKVTWISWRMNPGVFA